MELGQGLVDALLPVASGPPVGDPVTKEAGRHLGEVGEMGEVARQWRPGETWSHGGQDHVLSNRKPRRSQVGHTRLLLGTGSARLCGPLIPAKL